mmetsp:Transcript_24747/g.45443  ORF Transcript_24747/g.45443 Transcript_24747/m.45443 type:complete len:192 (+) Transcript_24747:33-608(+)
MMMIVFSSLQKLVLLLLSLYAATAFNPSCSDACLSSGCHKAGARKRRPVTTAASRTPEVLLRPFRTALRSVMMTEPPFSMSARDKARIAELRKVLKSAEEEMVAETEHSKKFMWRGRGLRHDFTNADQARQRALLKGAIDNEQALWSAVEEAEAAGLAQEYLEDAIRVANQLGIIRAELQSAYASSGEGAA